MKRFNIEMNGDDLIIEPAADGDWVEYEEASAEVERLRAEVKQLTEQNHRLVGRIDELKAGEL